MDCADRPRCLLLISVLFLVSTLVMAADQTSAIITLRERALVSGPNIELGEIASIQAPDTLSESLNALFIAKAPPPETNRSIYLYHIQSCLEKSGLVPLSQVSLDGQPEVQVQTASPMDLTPEDLVCRAQDFLRQQFSDPSLNVEPIGDVQPLPMLDSSVHLVFRCLSPSRLEPETVRISLLMQRMLNERVLSSQILALRPIKKSNVAIARRLLPVDHIITLEDIVLKDGNPGTSPIVGRRLLHDVRAGEEIFEKDVSETVLVRQGEQVRLLICRGALRVSTGAQALQAGSYGQVIRLKNLSSGEEQLGIITGPKQVSLQLKQDVSH